MHVSKLVLALASCVNALVVRDAPCCFGLSADGGPGGAVGQLGDGQNRIGQGLQGAQYCISNGGLTDGAGRGCILTPPTTQFQCDAGAAPTGGFAIDTAGKVTYNGASSFVACPTGDNGGFNLYSSAPSGQQGCVPVSLTADNCKAPAPAPAPSPSPSPSPAPVPAPSTCPANLNGAYQYPHLIVPVDSSAPDTAAGTSYNGTASGTIASLFNFDIPPSYAGAQCALVFLLPAHDQLTTSSYALSGSGDVDFAALAGPVSQATTARTAPAVATDYGVTRVAPGGAYVVASFACPAGQAVAYRVAAVGDTALSYFQDYNPAPIGLYITSC